jgi:tRNA A37 threonylcarbamoyladenosine synthetase subunit TsaC/SUA5/YrdC
MPKQPKRKRRAAVQRSHSPKNAASPCSVSQSLAHGATTNCLIKRIAPTVTGIEAGARVMCSQNQVVALPTETVYMLCTTMNVNETDNDCVIRLKQAHSSSPRRPVVILESAQQLNTLYSLKETSYAIRLKNGKATPPVRLNESRQVFQKLATKFWPGPIQIYMSVDDSKKVPSFLLQDPPFATTESNNTQYLPLSCPSHPLIGRFLTEVFSNNTSNDKDRFMLIGTPTNSTTARNVCDQYSSNDLYVLVGEEQREVFHVPTCAYGRECATCLYIDSTSRLIYIVGSKEETMVHVSPSIITKSLLHMTNLKNLQQRVTCAVLKNWKVIDRRM